MVTLFCFAFFSVQKSRPDASKSNYVTDGVRRYTPVVPEQTFCQQQLQLPRGISGSLRYFLYFFLIPLRLYPISTQHG